MSKIFRITPLRLAAFFGLSAPLAANAALEGGAIVLGFLAVGLLATLLPGAIVGVLVQKFTVHRPKLIGFAVFIALGIAGNIYLAASSKAQFSPFDFWSNPALIIAGAMFSIGFTLGRKIARWWQNRAVVGKQ